MGHTSDILLYFVYVDVRSPGEAVHVLEPYKNDQCSRPHLGKWLGCAALDSGEDWLVSVHLYFLLFVLFLRGLLKFPFKLVTK